MFKRIFNNQSKTERHIKGLEDSIDRMRKTNKRQHKYIRILEKTLKLVTVVSGISKVEIEQALLMDEKLNLPLNLEHYDNPQNFTKVIRWR